jgi:hypothetical protein
MRDQRTNGDQGCGHPVLSRRDVLAAGAGLIAAPLLAATKLAFHGRQKTVGPWKTRPSCGILADVPARVEAART